MKSTWKLSTICAVSMLSGCSYYDAKDAVKEQLIDPESAIFDEMNWTGSHICGFVNSRNRMGGYVGWTAFVYDGNKANVGGSLSEGPSVIGNCPDKVVSRYIEMQSKDAEAALRRQGL
ncbi:hypothetical protein [Sphingorhabdus sp. Alg239-R122]|uniref:hypothetical protein n=1 Tax=Sphingorhabdus sp. Alg239-R122 TaxID=2305989 RepID=UPI0013DB0A6E|nr:hypothetical protein [Sphingorhabdus sp. Alg239-R122]